MTSWRANGQNASAKSKAEIEAAIAKVGDNPTTVMKELRVKRE
jgi:hypothetical protein